MTLRSPSWTRRRFLGTTLGGAALALGPRLAPAAAVGANDRIRIGVVGTEAHVHEGARGKSGPAIISLTKRGGDTFVAPAGATLNEEQLESFMAGNLYVNVHTAANPLGEIRGQVMPR